MEEQFHEELQRVGTGIKRGNLIGGFMSFTPRYPKNTIRVVKFEISGICNGRCPWCVTGRRVDSPGKLLSLNDFCRCIQRLKEIGIITEPRSIDLHLYVRGEPTLNPELPQMLEYLAKNGLKATISINCSNSLKLTREESLGLKEIIFAVSGMTSESSLRITGFSEIVVLGNIVSILQNLRSVDWSGRASMRFLMYRHNLGEISDALNFCFSNDIIFDPGTASLADHQLLSDYLDNKLDCEMLAKIERELLAFDWPELLKFKPKKFVCELQENWLLLNEKCEALRCCMVMRNNPDYSFGSIFDMSYEDILAAKSNSSFCSNCLDKGLAYLGCVMCYPRIDIKTWISIARR